MTDPAELVNAWIRAYNERDAGCMRALIAPGYRHERPSVVVDGAENFIAFTEAEWANFPEARLDAKEIIGAGTHVVVEGTWSFTNSKPLTLPNGPTYPATGRKAVLPLVAIYDIVDGLLTSDRNYWDRLSFFTQLGWPVPGA